MKIARNRPGTAVTLAMLGILAGVLSPASAEQASDIVYPTIAGQTTVRGSGVTGIKLRVPEDITWFTDNIEWSVSPDVNQFMAAIRNQGDASEQCDLCFNGTFVSGWPGAPFTEEPWNIGECSNEAGQETGCPIQAGIVEMYVISDGEVTVTMRFPELTGVVEVEATGDVDGVLERIPAECLDPACTVLGGGKVRTIGENGRAAAAGVRAWAWAYPGTVNPNDTSAVACAHPGYFSDKSADPADHPYGCDIDDPLNDQSSQFLLPSPGLNGGGWFWSDGSGKTHGAQYLGFTARSVTTLEPSSIEAWGYWVNEGIACPSEDFFDCHRPAEI